MQNNNSFCQTCNVKTSNLTKHKKTISHFKWYKLEKYIDSTLYLVDLLKKNDQIINTQSKI